MITSDSEFITYEYKAIYTWILYALIIGGLIGSTAKLDPLFIAAMGGIIIYFIITLTKGHRITSKIREAMRNGKVEVSGSKYSFKNPLRIKIPNQ